MKESKQPRLCNPKNLDYRNIFNKVSMQPRSCYPYYTDNQYIFLQFLLYFMLHSEEWTARIHKGVGTKLGEILRKTAWKNRTNAPDRVVWQPISLCFTHACGVWCLFVYARVCACVRECVRACVHVEGWLKCVLQLPHFWHLCPGDRGFESRPAVSFGFKLLELAHEILWL